MTGGPPWDGAALLIDNSAFTHQAHSDVEEDWEAAIDNDQLLISHGFLIEVLFSATSASDYDSIREELIEAFDLVRFTQDVWELAFDAQAHLAHYATKYQRRFSPIDLLTASAAHYANVGVLHYDKNYDEILAATPLEFRSQWIAPRGSLHVTTGDERLNNRKQTLNLSLGQFSVEQRVKMYDQLIELTNTELVAAGLEVPEPITDD